jgi:iron complex outermembrane recepter protein
MKNLIILLTLLPLFVYGQDVIRGKITDKENSNPLPNANVILTDGSSGTVSDLNGEFSLAGVKPGNSIKISYLGYETRIIKIESDQAYLNISLEQKIIPSQSVLVIGSLGKQGITPVVLEKIGREEIEQNYSVQDIPQFLSSQPSVMSYSESGNGIGYNYISIRGFDQRRISVSINGIPQNDPEDHNVYWLDFPDLLGSTEMLQVQRGAGSGVFGYPAIGGSINIITSSFTGTPGFRLEGYGGSYNTQKYSASYSSGLINNKYSVSAKLSRIKSSGYRDLSWTELNAYHFSAIRFDENLTTQINIFGGPIKDGLAYNGLPKFAIYDKELRKKNYSGWSADYSTNEITSASPRRPEEIENFFQPHFELMNEWRISDKINFNSALYLVLGNGFFDYDGSWGWPDYFRLTPEYGFSEEINPQNAIIRAKVENTQYGWIPRVSFNHTDGELILGGEVRLHKSNHWGSIKYAENLPADFPSDYKYYFYNGRKDIFSSFIQENYRLSNRINLLGEVQFTYNKYRLFNEKFVNTDFSVNHFFVNPRFGINYKISDRQNIFLSFARVSREPRLKNYYDAAESSGGEEPLFYKNDEGVYDFSDPLVKPETMNDIELGSSFSSSAFNLSINLFYMSFDNEIIKNGKLDRFGQPVTGNAKRTLHQGIELGAVVRLFKGVEVWGNASYSRNIIKDAEFFISGNESVNLSNNRISGFPDFLANAGISYSNSGARIEMIGKYVGEFYSDNYDKNLSLYLIQYPGFVSYSDNINEAYFVADLTASYQNNVFNASIPSKVYVRVNNLFDKLYSAYAIGEEFFPAAEINFIAGIQVGF